MEATNNLLQVCVEESPPNTLSSTKTSLVQLPDDIIENVLYFTYYQSNNSVYQILPLLYTCKQIYYTFHYLVYKFINPIIISNEEIGDRDKSKWYNPLKKGKAAIHANKLYHKDLNTLFTNYPLECYKIQNLVIEYNCRSSMAMKFYDLTKSLRAFDNVLCSCLQKFTFLRSIELDIGNIYGLRLLNYIQTNCSPSLEHMSLVIHDYRFSNFNKFKLLTDIAGDFKTTLLNLRNNQESNSNNQFKLKTFSMKSTTKSMLSTSIHTSLLIAGRFDMTPDLIAKYYQSSLVKNFEKYIGRHLKLCLLLLGQLVYCLIENNRRSLTSLEFLGVDLYLIFCSIIEIPKPIPPTAINRKFEFPNLRVINVNDASYLKILEWIFKFNSKFDIAVFYHSNFSGNLTIVGVHPLDPITRKRSFSVWHTNTNIINVIRVLINHLLEERHDPQHP